VARRKEPGVYQGLTQETKHLLKTAPEEAPLVEFKRIADGVGDELIAALANAAALRGADEAVLLIGVDEATRSKGQDAAQVVGLPSDKLTRIKKQIMSALGNVQPARPEVDLIEENRGTVKPILRLRIRPTSPPHYDQKGRRAVRIGEQMKAMNDEEMLALLDARYSGRYAEIARSVLGESTEVQRRVFEDLERAADARAHEQAENLDQRHYDTEREIRWTVEAAVSEAALELTDAINSLEQGLEELPDRILGQIPDTAEDIAHTLGRTREMAALRIAMRWDSLSESTLEKARVVLATGIDLWDYLKNAEELVAWRTALVESPEAREDDLERRLSAALDRLAQTDTTMKVDLDKVREQFMARMEPLTQPKGRRRRR
jgi:hypothetical protein